MAENAPPRVLISYSHDSAEHEEKVRLLADQLRKWGVDAWLDQYVVFPPKGWTRWIDAEFEKADFILLVCTETYRKRFEDKGAGNSGMGVSWQALKVIRQLYRQKGENRRFIPVYFQEEDARHIPQNLSDYPPFKLPEHYEPLFRLITGQPDIVPPPLGPLRKLPSREEVKSGASSGSASQEERESQRRDQPRSSRALLGSSVPYRPSAPSEKAEKRRLDASVPSRVQIGQSFELVFLVRFPQSPRLGKDILPGRKRSDVKKSSETGVLRFKRDQESGNILPANLSIEVAAPDFDIQAPTRTLEVPYRKWSKELKFLLQPKRVGRCPIHIYVRDRHQNDLGNLAMSTEVGPVDAPGHSERTVVHLILVVEVRADGGPFRLSKLQVGVVDFALAVLAGLLAQELRLLPGENWVAVAILLIIAALGIAAMTFSSRKYSRTGVIWALWGLMGLFLVLNGLLAWQLLSVDGCEAPHEVQLEFRTGITSFPVDHSRPIQAQPPLGRPFSGRAVVENRSESADILCSCSWQASTNQSAKLFDVSTSDGNCEFEFRIPDKAIKVFLVLRSGGLNRRYEIQVLP